MHSVADRWSGAEQWPYVRSVLGEEYQDASPRALSRIVADQFGEADLEQMEGFLQTLAQVGQVALPILGGVVGSLVAPGVGTVVGPAIGQLAAGALGQAA